MVRQQYTPDPPNWDEIMRNFRGSELQKYFTRLLEDKMKKAFARGNSTSAKAPSEQNSSARECFGTAPGYAPELRGQDRFEMTSEI
uniref:Uncharacterized protein n=1 Tax=Oryza rufipogon TaxID=4529 RepID=A0A0E0ND53_ORYRU